MNSTNVITSNLQGPYSLNDLIFNKFCKDTKFSGIYMWGVKFNSAYYPIYVGKAENICERIFQHISSFTGGEYIIPEETTLIDPDRNISNLVFEYCNHGNLSHGLLYYPNGYFDFFNSPNNKINQTLQFVKDNFFTCWKITPNYSLNASIEEGNLAYAIGVKKLISSRYGVKNGNNHFINDFLELKIQ